MSPVEFKGQGPLKHTYQYWDGVGDIRCAFPSLSYPYPRITKISFDNSHNENRDLCLNTPQAAF